MFIQTKTWIEESNMTCNRYEAASLMLNKDQWWITGGNDGSSFLDSAEVYDVKTNQFQIQHVALPKPIGHHNLVKIDETRFVLLGGNSDSDKVHVYDR